LVGTSIITTDLSDELVNGSKKQQLQA
jgi:hypothetical protein